MITTFLNWQVRYSLNDHYWITHYLFWTSKQKTRKIRWTPSKRLRFLFKKYKIPYLTRKKKLNIFTYTQLYSHIVSTPRDCVNFNFNRWSLLQRIPTQRSMLNKLYIRFFYKKIKYHDYTKVFLDGDKPTLWMFSKSRQLQWSLYSKGTLRGHRYQNFLKFFYKTSQSQYVTTLTYIFLYQRLRLAWHTANIWMKEYCELSAPIYTHIQHGLIITMPIVYNIQSLKTNSILWNYYYYKSKLYLLRMKRWGYLRYKRTIYPWLKLKKKIPNATYLLRRKHRQHFTNIHFDRSVNTIILIRNTHIEASTPELQLRYNSLLRLYGYRYRV